MKVGDLVTLSKYGKDRDYNIGLRIAHNGGNLLGIVVKHRERFTYPYEVLWMEKVEPHGKRTQRHFRKELKHARQ